MTTTTETGTTQQEDQAPELAPRPGFRWMPQMPGRRNPDSLDPEATTTGDHEHQDQGEDRGGREGMGTSIPAFYRQRAKAYAKVAGTLLEAVGGWCNKLVGDVDDAFLADDDDMETIPPPLGRLAARRIKIGDPENLSDIEDMGMAAVGLIAWAAKGVSAVLAARRDRRRAEEGRAVHTDPGNG